MQIQPTHIYNKVLQNPKNSGFTEAAETKKTVLGNPVAENLSNTCLWWDGKTYVLIILAIVILGLAGAVVYLLRTRTRKVLGPQVFVPMEIQANVVRSPSFLQSKSSSQTYDRFSAGYFSNATADADSEHACMISRQRFSCPSNYHRTKSEQPPLSCRPEKPPRLHRPTY